MEGTEKDGGSGSGEKNVSAHADTLTQPLKLPQEKKEMAPTEQQERCEDWTKKKRADLN